MKQLLEELELRVLTMMEVLKRLGDQVHTLQQENQLLCEKNEQLEAALFKEAGITAQLSAEVGATKTSISELIEGINSLRLEDDRTS